MAASPAVTAAWTAAATPKEKVHRYLLARHGKTNFNKERRIQGSLDCPCVLTLDGVSQAAALGEYVARRQAGQVMDEEEGNVIGNGRAMTNGGAGGETDGCITTAVGPATTTTAPPISRTWCSPLTRCRQTYAAVSGCCPSLPEPTVRAELREIDFREWQGTLRSELIQNHREQWETFKKDPKSLRLEGGFAPVLDMWERASGNWEVIRSDAATAIASNVSNRGDSNAVVFIMTHGAIGQSMLLQSLGISVETYGKGKRYAFDNCECVEVEWADGEAHARRWRKVYPAATAWRDARASRRMASGAGLACER